MATQTESEATPQAEQETAQEAASQTARETAQETAQEAASQTAPQTQEQTSTPNAASEQPQPLIRQWIALKDGSCDVRYGQHAIDQLGAILRTAVGVPYKLALVRDSCASDEVFEEIQRSLTSQGFRVTCVHLQDADEPSLSLVEKLCTSFLDMGLTSDDYICVVGDVTLIALVGAAARVWCQGTPVCAVPLSFHALIDAATLPQMLTLNKVPAMLSLSAHYDQVVCDTSLIHFDLHDQDAQYARLMMIATCMAESSQAFSKLWDASYDLMDTNFETFSAQLLETLKIRGRIISSSALAVRNAASYGVSFARALQKVSHATYTACFAESLRFCARLACALEHLEIDDVLAQDELLDRFECGSVCEDVDPQQLFCALKDELFLRSHKAQLPLPQALGRVRMTSVTDELLHEHIDAWCMAHKE